MVGGVKGFLIHHGHEFLGRDITECENVVDAAITLVGGMHAGVEEITVGVVGGVGVVRAPGRGVLGLVSGLL